MSFDPPKKTDLKSSAISVQKSEAAYRSIGEVATLLSLPSHVLRFWETRFLQLKPLKRQGGRRFYGPKEITFLRIIQRLLHDEGYTIKGVQRLLDENAIDLVTGQLHHITLKQDRETNISATELIQKDLRIILKDLHEIRTVLS